MTKADEAKEKYIKLFGGFPEFLFMGAEEEEIIKAVEIAIKTGKEIEPPLEGADY